MTSNAEKISQFRDLTQASESQAQFFLESHNWQLEVCITIFSRTVVAIVCGLAPLCSLSRANPFLFAFHFCAVQYALSSFFEGNGGEGGAGMDTDEDDAPPVIPPAQSALPKPASAQPKPTRCAASLACPQFRPTDLDHASFSCRAWARKLTAHTPLVCWRICSSGGGSGARIASLADYRESEQKDDKQRNQYYAGGSERRSVPFSCLPHRALRA